MAPVNDNFQNSTVLSGSIFSVTGTNVGATGQAGEPNHAGVSNPIESVWWTWTAPVSGSISLNTFGSNYDTTLGVYRGSAVNSLTTVAAVDDSFGTLQSVLTFNVTAGTTYRIAVDGFSSSEGSIALNLNYNGTAGNDNLNGNSASNVIYGFGGNDVINGNGGRDFLFGGDGNDRIAGASGNDSIDGGNGNDTLYGNGGLDTLVGGSGDDQIYGGSQADNIIGGSGNDTIYANGGGDVINSNDGLDVIYLGGAARVILDTGAGQDTIINFQLGATKFDISGSTSNLSFTNSSQGVQVRQSGDLLAIVQSQTAATFASNISNIFV